MQENFRDLRSFSSKNKYFFSFKEKDVYFHYGSNILENFSLDTISVYHHHIYLDKCRSCTCPEIRKNVLKFNNLSWNFVRFFGKSTKFYECYLKSLKWTHENANSTVLCSKTVGHNTKCCAFVMPSTLDASFL